MNHNEPRLESLAVDENRRRTFEAAWISGTPELIEEHLPPRLDPRYLATLIELVLLDLVFRGKSPASAGGIEPATLDPYLHRFPELGSPEAREALNRQRRLSTDSSANMADVTADTSGPGHEKSPAIDPSEGRTAARDSTWRVGDKRDDYELLEVLGEGGMGAVFKARHCLLKRTVALKVIRLRCLDDPDARARFQREIEAIGRLPACRHTVHATDARKVDGVHVLVMEFVDGVNAGALVSREQLIPIADACEIARQAALGLEHIHRHGLIHRDIKPSNLLIEFTGLVKIVDLGLARLREESEVDAQLTQTGYAMGTPDFMAPEQWDDARTVDVQADLYSLGCTLYFLLTGSAPFYGERAYAAKREAHLRKTPSCARTQRADVPEDVALIVTRLLEKHPSARFASAQAVAEALTPYSESANLAELLRTLGIGRTQGPTPIATPVNTTLPKRDPNAGAAKKKHPPGVLPWLAAPVFILVFAACVLIAAGIWRNELASFLGFTASAPATSQPQTLVTHADVWIRRGGRDDSIEHCPLVKDAMLDVQQFAPRLARGDDFNLRVQFNRPTIWHLLWFDTNGKLTIAISAEAASDTLRYPSDASMMSIHPNDPAGRHMLVVVAGNIDPSTAVPLLMDGLAGLGMPPQSTLLSAGAFHRGPGVESSTQATFVPDYLAQVEERLPPRLQLLYALQLTTK